MDNSEHQKVHIERAINRARDGVGDRIDELDRKLRNDLDPKKYATAHAPQLIGAGAIIGFLVGFGFPKPLRKLLKVGVPLALVAYKVKSAYEGGDS